MIHSACVAAHEGKHALAELRGVTTISPWMTSMFFLKGGGGLW